MILHIGKLLPQLDDMFPEGRNPVSPEAFQAHCIQTTESLTAVYPVEAQLVPL